MTFCGRGGTAVSRELPIFTKNRNERFSACSDVAEKERDPSYAQYPVNVHDCSMYGCFIKNIIILQVPQSNNSNTHINH